MQQKAKVISNKPIAKDVYKMELEKNFKADAGQFIEIKIPNFYLRRPISISEIKQNSFSIIYKTFGKGTKELTKLNEIDILAPLGNGFELEEKKEVLLIGGGVGVPPLYEMAKRYTQKNIHVKVILGFNSKEDIFYEKEFKDLGCECFVATMDGSYGTKGTVIDIAREKDLFKMFTYACGPLPMLRAVNEVFKDGYISLESRMACGVGVCMGCVVKNKNGDAQRVCVEGPVFKMGEIELC